MDYSVKEIINKLFSKVRKTVERFLILLNKLKHINRRYWCMKIY